MQSIPDFPIGTLNTGSLHAALKDYVDQSGDHRQQNYLAPLPETLQQTFTTSVLREMALSERVDTRNRCHLFAIVQN